MACKERLLWKNSSLFVLMIGAFLVSQFFIISSLHFNGPQLSHRKVLSPGAVLQEPKRSVLKKRPPKLAIQELKPIFVHHEDNTTKGEAAAAAARDYASKFVKFGRGPLNFFHLPKTAGTAVEEAAAKQSIPWGSCRFFHKPKRDICPYPSGPDWPKHVGWWHLPAYLFPVVGSNPYQSTDLFAIIRDPYERMVSEFYYICTLKVKDWRPDQCDNRTRLFEASYLNKWLSRKLEGRTSQTAEGYLADNGHFTPQHEFLVGPQQVRVVDYVLRMDNPVSPLAEQFARLMAAFDMPKNMTLPFMGAISSGARNTTQHLTTHHLDQSTLDWIHRLYPDDFDVLGYSRRSK